jgi:NTP pyrophosphatase (non-canonical NTP hydrolase)
MKADLNKYSQFVEGVTSNTSNNHVEFVKRLTQLESKFNVPLMITSYTGLCGEAGEFSEIFKKVIFHGKEFTPEERAHAAKELGDIIFYWTNACRAIGVDPNEVIQANQDKLMARYPGGVFDPEKSNNRKAGDI